MTEPKWEAKQFLAREDEANPQWYVEKRRAWGGAVMCTCDGKPAAQYIANALNAFDESIGWDRESKDNLAADMLNKGTEEDVAATVTYKDKHADQHHVVWKPIPERPTYEDLVAAIDSTIAHIETGILEEKDVSFGVLPAHLKALLLEQQRRFAPSADELPEGGPVPCYTFGGACVHSELSAACGRCKQKGAKTDG